MLRKIGIGATLLLLVLAVAACANFVAVPAPATMSTPETLKLAWITVWPTEVYPGEGVFITTQLINTDDAEGNYTIELVIDDIVELKEDVALPARGIQTLNFVVSRDMPGAYRVALGELTGQFAVVESYPSTRFCNPNPADDMYYNVPSCCW